jgi:hypothetical protein
MRRDESSSVTLKKKEKLVHDQKKHKLHSSEELFSLVTQKFLSLLLKRVSREEEEEHEMLKC